MLLYLKESFVILVPVIIGYSFIVFLFRKSRIDKALAIGLSYGLGCGTIALWMFLLGLLKISLNIVSISFPLLIASLILSIYSNYTKTHRISYPNEKILKNNFNENNTLLKITNIILIAYIAINVLYSFFYALNTPIHSWDALATIAFKAKIFYFSNGIPNLNKLPHSTYPILTPLLEYWVTLVIGTWSDYSIKIIFPFTLISFLIIQYKFIEDTSNKTWGLFGCALLLSSSLFLYHSSISYRDFLLMYFNCTTIMMMLMWYRKKELSYLIISSLLAGFATFTKLEGSAFFIVYIILLSIINFTNKKSEIRNKMESIITFIIPSLTICIFFHIFKIINGVTKSSKITFDFTLSKLDILPNILKSFANNIFFSGNWNILWIVLFILTLLSLLRKPNREIQYILLSIILFFGLYSSVSLLTVNYIWISGINHYAGLSRLILHFFPLTTLAISLLGSHLFK